MWFDSGWNVFVEYYSICIGSFLVFRYEGNSHFNVHVYDLKASQINYPSNSLNNSEECRHDKHVKDIEDGDFAAEIMGSHPTSSTSHCLINKDFNEFLGHDGKKYKNPICTADLKNMHHKKDGHHLLATFQSSRDKGIQSSEVELTSTADEAELYFLNGTQENTKKAKRETELSKVEVKEELLAMNSPSNAPKRWRDVTTEEKQSAFLAAAMFKPANPFCRIIMQPSYDVPRCFARRYMNGVNGTITPGL